jgi:hypothetical protein
MHVAYKARSLGWRLGVEQRLEHDRLVPRLHLGEGSLVAVALLAWRFEPHGLADTPYLRQCFLEGYERGYRLSGRPAPLVTRA